MAITYRTNIESDKAALIKLWDSSGWGSITEEQWDNIFLHTPMGPAMIMLAIEEATQEIVAQFAFILLPGVTDGHQIKACRPSSIIVNESFRSRKGFIFMQDMIRTMYSKAIEILTKQGVDLIYMLPDPRWSRILFILPFFESTNFPLWSLKLPLIEELDLPDLYTIKQINAADKKIDLLWLKFSRLYKSMIVRDSSTLPWKISLSDNKLFSLLKNGELIGLFAPVKRRKDNQWLIDDLVAVDTQEALKTVLIAACKWIGLQLEELPDEEKSAYRKIAILSTPSMEPILKELGFYKDNYNFLFTIHILNKELTKRQIEPSQWYISARD